MARPLPVNLFFAGTGAILLVSGIGGKSLGDVLKGNFGNIEVKKPNIGESETAPTGTTGTTGTAGEPAAGTTVPVSSGGGGAFAPSPTSFSHSTVAPPPVQGGRHPTKQQQAQGIASILLSHGITHPNSRQLQQARLEYERATGVAQYQTAGSSAEEFIGGLPVV